MEYLKRDYRKDEWVFEINSGYSGYRNLITDEWICKDYYMRIIPKHEILKSNFKIGKYESTVVTDCDLGFEGLKGHNRIEYYGGNLVCESIPDKRHAHLIAAAPKLLHALMSIENDDNKIPKSIWDLRNEAIATALNY